MAVVCGIDPSLTNSGIAILTDGQPSLITSTGIGGHDGADYRTRSRRLRAVCAKVITTILDHTTPDLVVIEGPAYAAKFGNGFDRAGLWHGLYAALDARHTPIAVCAPQTRAKWATGKGNAQKADVLAAVQSWWPNLAIADHDRADALVLATIGAHHHGDPMPFTTKPRHTTALEAIAWPA